MKSAEMNVILFDGSDVIATSGFINPCGSTVVYHIDNVEASKGKKNVTYTMYNYNDASGIWMYVESKTTTDWTKAINDKYYHVFGSGQTCKNYHDVNQ